MAAGCRCRKPDWARPDRGGSRFDRIVAICCCGSDGSYGAAHVRALREESEDPGRALDFPFLCPNGVWLVARGRDRWRRRDTLGHFRWNLGRVASRFNGRVYIGNDPECRTAHPARILWNEDAMEHETYVRWACARHPRLRASCFQRDHRVSGLCGVGVVRFANFGAVRACWIDNLCNQHSRYLCAAAKSRTSRACDGGDNGTAHVRNLALKLLLAPSWKQGKEH